MAPAKARRRLRSQKPAAAAAIRQRESQNRRLKTSNLIVVWLARLQLDGGSGVNEVAGAFAEKLKIFCSETLGWSRSANRLPRKPRISATGAQAPGLPNRGRFGKWLL